MRLAPLLVALLLAMSTALLAVARAPADQPRDRATPGQAQYDHIFVIVEENEEAPSIIGNPNAPTMNQLAQQYGLATNSFGVIHPSEGNYVALTDADAHGVTDDNAYTTHQFTA